MEDSYTILGVSRDASDDDIKRAYRSLSRRFHPDANISNPDKASCGVKFMQIQQAYTRIMKERSGSNPGDLRRNNKGSTDNESQYPERKSDRREYCQKDDSTDRQEENSHQKEDHSRQREDHSYQREDYSYERENLFHQRENLFHQKEDHSYQREDYSYQKDDIDLREAAGYLYRGCFKEAVDALNTRTERTARWYFYSAAANQGCGNNMIALDHARTAARMDPGNPEYLRLVNRLESVGIRYQKKQHSSAGTISAGNLCLALCTAETICSMCISSGLCTGGGNN